VGKAIIIAGTPGTGKTSITRLLVEKCGLQAVNLSDLAIEKGFIQYYDAERNTYVIDEEKLIDYLENMLRELEGHLVIQTHYPEIIPSDLVEAVFILRTNPLILEKRLMERNWSKRKINENVMAEILGVIAYNAVEAFGADKVYEIDTSNTKPEEVANLICSVIRGHTMLEPGVRIDWLSILPPEEVFRFENYLGSED
jgi:adenylate kinase